MRRFTLAALLLPLLLAAATAGAAEEVTSAAIWRVSGPQVSLRVAFPRDAVRLFGQPGKPLPATEAVARQVLGRSQVEQDHTPCPAADLGYDLGRIEPLYLGAGLVGFEMLFQCPHAQGTLVLREQALSDRGVPQMALAAVYAGTAPPVTRLNPERGIEIPTGQPPAASRALDYASLGLRGLPGRGLHLLALLGLLLTLRHRGERAGLAAGLGAGYLAAAVGAAGGFVLAPGPEASFDGMLVLLAAALIMGRATGELKKPALGLAAVTALCAAVALLRGEGAISLTLAGAGMAGFSLLWLGSLPGVCAARLALAGLALGLVDGFALPMAAAPLHALVALPAAATLGYNSGAALTALGLAVLLNPLRRGLSACARGMAFWGYVDRPLLADLWAAVLACAGVFEVLTA